MMAAAFLAASACGPRTAVPSPSAPAPPPILLANRTPVDSEGEAPRWTCVVQNGRLAVVEWHYNPVSGDSSVDGRRFREVYPATAEYAAAAPWNAGSEPIVFRGHWQRRVGLPRVLDHRDVVPVDVFQGVTVFAMPGAQPRLPEVIWFPFAPGCQFQSYEIAETAGAVRG